MKKLVLLVLAILSLVGLGIYNLFFNLQAVPHGNLIRSIQSPHGNYVIKTYVSEDDPLSANAVRGELVDLKRQKVRTIYWNYYDQDPYVKWLNNSEVLIGRQTLNILKGDTYDWRSDDNWVRQLPRQFPKDVR